MVLQGVSAPPDYAPIHCLRCHFGDKKAVKFGYRDDDPCDEITNVWACAAEPSPGDSGQSGSSATNQMCRLRGIG